MISDLNKDGLQETKRLIEEADEWGDAQVVMEQVNISDEVQVQALLESTVAAFGRIDYAVNAVCDHHGLVHCIGC